jgi:hypothetical protein
MTNIPNNFETTGKICKATAEAIGKTIYWFHDFTVTYEDNRFNITRNINLCVKVIAIIMVLIIFHRICPDVLPKLIDILPAVVKELRSKRDNLTPLGKGYL